MKLKDILTFLKKNWMGAVSVPVLFMYFYFSSFEFPVLTDVIGAIGSEFMRIGLLIIALSFVGAWLQSKSKRGKRK